MHYKTKQSDLLSAQQGAIHIENQCIHFKLRTNNRIKSSRLLVSAEEGLVIETPKSASLKWAQKLIQEKKNWVVEALKSAHQKREQAKQIKHYKQSVLVYGKEKFIEIRRGQAKDYILESKHKIILGFENKRVPAGAINKILENWLKQKAQRYLPLRVSKLAKNKFQFNKVAIKNQKTLWGSCSSDKNINLNWRLVMAPRYASDYIILHELSHTLHLDHSPKFWKVVASVCPKYQKAEDWFENYGFILHFDFDF